MCFFLWPFQSSWDEKNSNNPKKSKTLILLITWLILRLFFFVCVDLPFYESWEENNQTTKKIQNSDSHDYLINFEIDSYLFVLPYNSERKIIKSKTLNLFIIWLILKICKFWLCCLLLFERSEKNYQIIKNIKNIDSFWWFD